jgi:hypothetical protein
VTDSASKRPKVSIQLGLPGILSVGTDDIRALFSRSRRASQGPFMLIGRNRNGLALDTSYAKSAGHSPILWPAHAEPQQLWAFRKTEHPGEYLIVSVDSGLLLDAGSGSEPRRVQI